MFKLIEPLPRSPIDPVNEVLHGITVTDPYRWLEDSESAQTRSWLEAQTKYGRAYLDSIPGREHICKRVRELLDVETYDSLQKVGRCYFFRKRLCGQEQPCIFMREGRDGEDCLLIDPRDRLSGKNVAVKPIRVSPDGRLLLYEVKEGGAGRSNSSTFKIDAYCPTFFLEAAFVAFPSHLIHEASITFTSPAIRGPRNWLSVSTS
jgi:prolyl oligopeptidase